MKLLPMKNVLTFDIEDWFHAEVFGSRFPMHNWDQLESRVKGNTEIILNFLSKKNVKATLFFLGWVAEKYPEIVKFASEEGHEIASHGYTHTRVDKLKPDEFRNEVRESAKLLSSISDKKIIGFRAPTFSITKKTLWALPILLEEGMKYDSSIFPIYHDRYGIPDAPSEPYVIHENGSHQIVEFPMPTIRITKYKIPFGGGGYFRLYPFWLSMKFMEKYRDSGRSIIFYAHPWEFDVGMPKIDLAFLKKIRHYHGINKFLERLEIITSTFEFTSFERSSIWDSVEDKN